MSDTYASAGGRKANKSPEAFRTISEVANDLDVPQHVLRFWESKFSQVKPLKRGGGRRYYRPEDVDLLRGIRHLLYTDGYTIKGVQKLLREHGAKSVMESGRSLMHGAAGAAAQSLRRSSIASAEAPAQPETVSPAAPASQTEQQARPQSVGLGLEQRRRIADVIEELSALRGLLRERGGR
jgi:DNA-binding transcriptional MerR regulator